MQTVVIMLLVYKVTANAELLFAELFHFLLSLDDELNIAQSLIIYFYLMNMSIDVYVP